MCIVFTRQKVKYILQSSWSELIWGCDKRVWNQKYGCMEGVKYIACELGNLTSYMIQNTALGFHLADQLKYKTWPGDI